MPLADQKARFARKGKPRSLEALAFYLGAHGIDPESVAGEIDAGFDAEAATEKRVVQDRLRTLEGDLEDVRRKLPEAESVWERVRATLGDVPPSSTEALVLGGFAAFALALDAVFIAPSSGVNCGSAWQQSFGYDAFGNISKSGSLSFQPTYLTSNQFSLSGGNVRYDGDGNLLTDNLNSYTWDPNWGTMSSVNTGSMIVTATYDALGRVVEQYNGSTYSQILYSPIGKAALMSGSALVKAFAVLPGGGTAIYTSSGLSYYRHADWLGSARLDSTQSRGLYSSTAYAPFGEQYAASGTADPSFTGQNSDTVPSLYDFWFRRLSSSQGRWISPDPAGMAAADIAEPQSWNRYAYVVNSPLDYVDPMGLVFVEDPVTGCIYWEGGSNAQSSNGNISVTVTSTLLSCPSGPSDPGGAGNRTYGPGGPGGAGGAGAPNNKTLPLNPLVQQQYQQYKQCLINEGTLNVLTDLDSDQWNSVVQGKGLPNTVDQVHTASASVLDTIQECGQKYPLSVLAPNGPSYDSVYPLFPFWDF